MSTETPSKGRSKTDSSTIRIAIGLVVVLAALAMLVTVFSSTPSSNPLLLGDSTPMKVTVPSISSSSSLIPLGQKKDGSLDVPSLKTPEQASWYDKSPMPGSVGPAIVLGHVDGSGKPGVFINLSKTKAGDQVFVDRADGQTAVFTVSRVDTVLKSNFPTQQVYGDTSGAEIRLITCGGALDREARNYLSNVIVYGNLTGVRKT